MNVRRIAPKSIQRKTAAYARVSTLSEAQEESYETQVRYYQGLIDATEEWQFAGGYADQGITGTSAVKRPQFMRMIEDAHAGKIDLILCKSISRFSRNFVEAQQYVHELKAIHVEVQFEKEGISSFNPSTDLVFSLMAAISQEESHTISENVKWSYRRHAEEGIRHLGNNRMLGYNEENGRLMPNGDAWIVRTMFDEYAAGTSPSRILDILQERGARRLRSEKPFTWSSVLFILKNEVYVGDRLIQKAPPQNFLTKKPDPTEPYDSKYIHGDHEGIVSREVWERVQNRLKREKDRRENGLSIRHTSHFLYGKVFCPICGEPYRRYTARRASGEHYKTWRCRGRVNSNDCMNRHIEETELLQGIADLLGMDMEAMNAEAVQSVERVWVEDGKGEGNNFLSATLISAPSCTSII